MALKTILCTKKYLTSHSLKIPIVMWMKRLTLLIAISDCAWLDSLRPLARLHWPFESGSFRPDDLFAPGRFAPLTCSPRVDSPRKVSRFAPLNCYYIIIDEVFFDNFLIIIYLLASCCGFTYCYRFSDIAISSVNLFIHMTI
jgi:hypothetical protein